MGKFVDLTGQRFGRLTVIERDTTPTHKKGTRWWCQCDCGNVKSILYGSLTTGRTVSCGCKHEEDIHKTQYIDITGQRFGMLTVIELAPFKKDEKAMWRCKCDCGNETITSGKLLRTGITKSCGCLKSAPTHGDSKTRLYWVWIGMRQRCNNPKNSAYSFYGGRGIKVCPEWDKSYESFKEWALSAGYDESASRFDMTLDRIDVNKGYSPENCRWATMKEQGRNRRDNHIVEFKGEKKPMSQWAEELNIPHSTLNHREKIGIPLDQPIRGKSAIGQ